jgi:hypothetical protein
MNVQGKRELGSLSLNFNVNRYSKLRYLLKADREDLELDFYNGRIFRMNYYLSCQVKYKINTL